MKFFLASLLICAIVATSGVLYIATTSQVNKMDSCTAPCVVNFTAPNMQEDMAGIDYSHGKVYVREVRP